MTHLAHENEENVNSETVRLVGLHSGCEAALCIPAVPLPHEPLAGMIKNRSRFSSNASARHFLQNRAQARRNSLIGGGEGVGVDTQPDLLDTQARYGSGDDQLLDLAGAFEDRVAHGPGFSGCGAV